MNRERFELYSHITVTSIGILLLVLVFFKFLFLPILPFIIAWAAAFALRPLCIFTSKKTKIPRKITSATVTIFIVVLGIGGIITVCYFALREAWELLVSLSSDERLYSFLERLLNPLGSIFGEGEVAGKIEESIGAAIKGALGELIGGIVSAVTDLATSVPRVLFFILVTVIASVYFAVDLDNVNLRVRKLLPSRVVSFFVKLKDRFFKVGVKYVRAYLIIMSITFAIMLTGFLIMRVENAFLLSLLISVLDVLPLIGVGTVLVPWSIFQLLFGKVYLGIGLALLLVVNETVRQIAEPKIIGKSLGIHPLVSLVLLYVGYSVFGFLGLLLVPVISVLLNVLIDKNDTAEVA